MGTLYVVATPIGNLEDISARAIRILGQVSLIAAEDTRQTRKLLSRFDIHTPMVSYYEHNKYTKTEMVITALESGDVALVSDAGTPVLNDPGFELVRAALEKGHTVTPIPGPSAPITALVVSGLPADVFLYLGYLPRKRGERQKVLKSVAVLPFTLVLLETPHRLLETLEDCQAVLGDRQVAVGREMTKLHEEIYRASISQAMAHFTSQAPRGEFTLVIGGASQPAPEHWDEEHLMSAIRAAVNSAETPAQIAGRLADESGWRKRDIYRLIVSADSCSS
jgi:16S rRNA (cytidine1402-2'-O)-methyltransferase